MRWALGSEPPYLFHAYPCARIQALLGDRDGAIEWLGKDYHARAGALVYIGSDPSLESKRAVRTVLTMAMCQAVTTWLSADTAARFQNKSSPMRLIGWSEMRDKTLRR
jgi:hypothetical protein